MLLLRVVFWEVVCSESGKGASRGTAVSSNAGLRAGETRGLSRGRRQGRASLVDESLFYILPMVVLERGREGTRLA